jgi:hypothetical protein
MKFMCNKQLLSCSFCSFCLFSLLFVSCSCGGKNDSLGIRNGIPRGKEISGLQIDRLNNKEPFLDGFGDSRGATNPPLAYSVQVVKPDGSPLVLTKLGPAVKDIEFLNSLQLGRTYHFPEVLLRWEATH